MQMVSASWKCHRCSCVAREQLRTVNTLAIRLCSYELTLRDQQFVVILFYIASSLRHRHACLGHRDALVSPRDVYDLIEFEQRSERLCRSDRDECLVFAQQR